MPIAYIIGGLALAILVLLALVFIVKFRTVSADEALIVTGTALGNGSNIVTNDEGKKIKVVKGGGTFVMPVLQKAETLSLLSHKLEVSTQNNYTKQGVPISVNAVCMAKIGSSVQEITTAAEQYLGKSDAELQDEVRLIIEGHLRSVLGALDVEQVYSDREAFAQEVQKASQRDLQKMGLQIISFVIRDVKDANQYLESLGQPRIAAVKRDAEIARKSAEKESRIKTALYEKEATQAEYERDTQIAEAQKEKELKIAAYRQEQERAKAEADQAYKLQEAVTMQKVTEEEMKIDIVKKEKQIELEEKEIQRREKQYDAEVKKLADAQRYKIETEAEALKVKNMREADAEKYRIEAEAKAHAEQKRLEGNAIAEAEKAKGLAEAEIIRSKGLAEAEAKQKIAEAFELFGQAAVLDMITKMLPAYAKEVASPFAHIDKITVVDTGGGKGGGANKVTGYVTDLMGTLQETLKASSGIDMKEMLENFVGKGNIMKFGELQQADKQSQVTPKVQEVINPLDLPIE